MKAVKAYENFDPITGEVFLSRTPNHYEPVDPKPKAPPVAMKRPSLRERVENLTNRNIDALAYYVGTEGMDMDVPDDPDAPLTESERIYMDVIAGELAEQAPLPDEGLPRPDVPKPSTGSAAAPEGVSSPPKAPEPPSPAPAGGTVPSR